ncbi:MAG TPA: hypothetical protein VKD08_06955, partial [Ignavibacteriaceae bacterium]|nr:hypothetical protein [Ignavibacteriaceae bacterium]
AISSIISLTYAEGILSPSISTANLKYVSILLFWDLFNLENRKYYPLILPFRKFPPSALFTIAE